jgi:predicted translin family RNA/ssDNA-binding protein
MPPLGICMSRHRYLGGVLDFAGELNRHAVMCATQRDTAAVSRCRDIVDAIMGQFLELGEQQLLCTA